MRRRTQKQNTTQPDPRAVLTAELNRMKTERSSLERRLEQLENKIRGYQAALDELTNATQSKGRK